MSILYSTFYNIKQGFKGLASSKTMAAISIGSITSSLVIFGIVLMMILNINQFVLSTKDQITEVRVFLNDNMGQTDIEGLNDKISSIDNIKNIRYETKEESFKTMKKSWGEDKNLLEGIENPLQNSFIVTVEDPTFIKDVVNELKKYNDIEDITYYQDVINKFLIISQTLKKIGIGIIICLLVVSLVILSNTIKSRVYSRKEEIGIMKYIGASDWFVISPFIIEGVIIGVLGALIALIVSSLMYSYLYDKINKALYSFIPNILLTTTDMIALLSIIFISIGIVIGTFGSVISVKKHLRV
jgi:cell division transport system permease protein